MRPLTRRQRVVVGIWVVLSVALWNGIFEMMVVRGVKEYLFRAALHEAGRRPFTPIAHVMDPAIYDATWVATLWTSVILLAALVTIRVVGYRVPGTGRVPGTDRYLVPGTWYPLIMHPLIHDWNRTGDRPPRLVMLNDETLRDGLQSPSVRCPAIEQKIEILHLIDRLGIDTADIGLPGAGPHVVRDVERLAREIASERLTVKANCAARTVIADITPVVEIAQRTGVPIECCTFIGSSPLRQYAEGWTLDQLLRLTEESIGFAVREGLSVMYVTEDTTRADPETLRQLYSAAIRAGASRVCVADTVGHATPAGAAAVVRFVGEIVEACGGGIGIDWHGHRDRDLAVVNTLAALEAGATRLHGTAVGIGERVGNTPMDLLLVNLVLMGYIERDLAALVEYCDAVSAATGVPIPANYPVVGRDAFRTATGVHAAAVIKAFRKQDRELVDAVYSGVPAGLVGREQEVEIGPMSGRSNVVFWLEKRGLQASEEAIERVFAKAKASDVVLTEEEIRLLLGAGHRA